MRLLAPSPLVQRMRSPGNETTTMEDWAGEDSSTDAQFRTLRRGPDGSTLKPLPVTNSGKGERLRGG